MPFKRMVGGAIFDIPTLKVVGVDMHFDPEKITLVGADDDLQARVSVWRDAEFPDDCKEFANFRARSLATRRREEMIRPDIRLFLELCEHFFAKLSGLNYQEAVRASASLNFQKSDI